MKQRPKKSEPQFKPYHPFQQTSPPGPTPMQYYLEQSKMQSEEPKQNFVRRILKSMYQGVKNLARYVLDKPLIVGEIQVFHQPYGPAKYLGQEQEENQDLKRKITEVKSPVNKNLIEESKQAQNYQSPQQFNKSGKKRKLNSQQSSSQASQQFYNTPQKSQLGYLPNNSQIQQFNSPSIRELGLKIKQKNKQEEERLLRNQSIQNNPIISRNLDLNRKTNFTANVNVSIQPKKIASTYVQTEFYQSIGVQASDGLQKEQSKQNEQVVTQSVTQYKEQQKGEAVQMRQEAQIDKQQNKMVIENKSLSPSAQIFNPKQQLQQFQQPEIKPQTQQLPSLSLFPNTQQKAFSLQSVIQQPVQSLEKKDQIQEPKKIQEQEKNPTSITMPKQSQVKVDLQNPPAQSSTLQNFQFPQNKVEVPFEDEGFAPYSGEDDSDEDQQNDGKEKNQNQNESIAKPPLSLFQISQNKDSNSLFQKTNSSQLGNNPVIGQQQTNLLQNQSKMPSFLGLQQPILDPNKQTTTQLSKNTLFPNLQKSNENIVPQQLGSQSKLFPSNEGKINQASLPANNLAQQNQFMAENKSAIKFNEQSEQQKPIFNIQVQQIQSEKPKEQQTLEQPKILKEPQISNQQQSAQQNDQTSLKMTATQPLKQNPFANTFQNVQSQQNPFGQTLLPSSKQPQQFLFKFGQQNPPQQAQQPLNTQDKDIKEQTQQENKQQIPEANLPKNLLISQTSGATSLLTQKAEDQSPKDLQSMQKNTEKTDKAIFPGLQNPSQNLLFGGQNLSQQQGQKSLNLTQTNEQKDLSVNQQPAGISLMGQNNFNNPFIKQQQNAFPSLANFQTQNSQGQSQKTFFGNSLTQQPAPSKEATPLINLFPKNEQAATLQKQPIMFGSQNTFLAKLDGKSSFQVNPLTFGKTEDNKKQAEQQQNQSQKEEKQSSKF